ncbi:MAG: hypothetical protein NZ534_05355 [Bacteroidia bacterium]|nr:hypothetical protein [Bacteroidia bacterium]
MRPLYTLTLRPRYVSYGRRATSFRPGPYSTIALAAVALGTALLVKVAAQDSVAGFVFVPIAAFALYPALLVAENAWRGAYHLREIRIHYSFYPVPGGMLHYNSVEMDVYRFNRPLCTYRCNLMDLKFRYESDFTLLPPGKAPLVRSWESGGRLVFLCKDKVLFVQRDYSRDLEKIHAIMVKIQQDPAYRPKSVRIGRG